MKKGIKMNLFKSQLTKYQKWMMLYHIIASSILAFFNIFTIKSFLLYIAGDRIWKQLFKWRFGDDEFQ